VTEPVVAVVSNIALDHLTYLGTRLEDIAREKIGIIKPGISCVTSVRQKHLVKMFEEAALRERRDCTDWVRTSKSVMRRTVFFPSRVSIRIITTFLVPQGRHQIDNAALAVATVTLLSEKGFRLENNAIYQGLKDTRWEGAWKFFRNVQSFLLMRHIIRPVSGALRYIEDTIFLSKIDCHFWGPE